jgi:hypothetical protein
MGVRARGLDWRLDDPHAVAGEHIAEDADELAVAVADQELKRRRVRPGFIRRLRAC